jgi:hypothetical protein
VLAENEGMLGLAERLGFSRRRDPDSPDILITEKRLALIRQPPRCRHMPLA